MNKSKTLNLVLIILVTIVLLYLLVNNDGVGKIVPIRTRILIENSYSNYAWSRYYNGMAICDDGTIYEWDMDDAYFNEVYNNVSDIEFGLDYESNLILKYSNKKARRVSASDMEKLRDYIENLNGYIDLESFGADMGSHAIIVWDYSNGTKVTIKETGDWEGENYSYETQEIIKIVNKYL